MRDKLQAKMIAVEIARSRRRVEARDVELSRSFQAGYRMGQRRAERPRWMELEPPEKFREAVLATIQREIARTVRGCLPRFYAEEAEEIAAEALAEHRMMPAGYEAPRAEWIYDEHEDGVRMAFEVPAMRFGYFETRRSIQLMQDDERAGPVTIKKEPMTIKTGERR